MKTQESRDARAARRLPLRLVDHTSYGEVLRCEGIGCSADAVYWLPLPQWDIPTCAECAKKIHDKESP